MSNYAQGDSLEDRENESKEMVCPYGVRIACNSVGRYTL